MIKVLMLGAALAIGAGAQAGGKPMTPEQAAKHVGETVTVQGRVTMVTVMDTPHTIYITFGPAYPHQSFTAVLYESAQDRFPNVKAVLGKTVIVRGTVRLQGKKPAIVLETADQLSVVV